MYNVYIMSYTYDLRMYVERKCACVVLAIHRYDDGGKSYMNLELG